MAEVKHTPEVELHAVFNGHYWDVQVGTEDYGQVVGSCHQNAVLGYGREGAERYARLFAAAPELFEAVSRMEAACERLAAERSPQIYSLMIEQGQSDNLLALDEARRDARAALSKATAQQEGR